MRYRRIACRFAEIAGPLPQSLEGRAWEALELRLVASPFFRPSADVFETDDGYVVVIEAAGVAEDEMEVFVHPDALVVSGHRRCDCGEFRYHASEIRYGPFRFDMPLPEDADPAHVEAKADRGLLRVILRKRSGKVA